MVNFYFRKDKKKFVLGSLIVILVIFLLFFLQKQTLAIDIDQIKTFILSFGILGPIVFILFNVVTIVISPLTSFFLWPVSLALFDFWPTFFYVFLASGLGGIVNFWIAKCFGRPLVMKLVGKGGLRRVDKFTEIIGLKLLVFARLFAGAADDYISYAAGLTSMDFKPYIVISVLVRMPMIFLNLYFINQILAFKPIYIVFLLIWSFLSPVLFSILIYKRTKKSKKRKK